MWRRKSSQMRRRTEIRMERREITIYRSGKDPAFRCAVCQDSAEMMRAEDAATALGIEVAVVRQWLADQRIHGSTTPDGQLLICSGSLRQET